MSKPELPAEEMHLRLVTQINHQPESKCLAFPLSLLLKESAGFQHGLSKFGLKAGMIQQELPNVRRLILSDAESDLGYLIHPYSSCTYPQELPPYNQLPGSCRSYRGMDPDLVEYELFSTFLVFITLTKVWDFFLIKAFGHDSGSI